MDRKCVWCVNPDADESDLTDPERQLCRAHMNEYDGTSESGYQHMLAEQAADLL